MQANKSGDKMQNLHYFVVSNLPKEHDELFLALMHNRHQLSQPVVGSKGWGAKDSAPHCRVLPSRYTGQCGPNYIQSRLCKICSESRTWWHRRTLRRQQKHEMETVDDPKIITKCYTQFCERQIAYKDMKWTIRGM